MVNQYDIQMDLTMTFVGSGESLKAAGTYFYTNQNKKMEVEGEMPQPEFEARVILVRMDKGKVREKFYGVWVDKCRIEGLWTHWGTLKTANFYLDVNIKE